MYASDFLHFNSQVHTPLLGLSCAVLCGVGVAHLNEGVVAWRGLVVVVVRQGYQMRAEEWGNVLLQPLLRIEWRSWQKLIKPSRPLPPPSSDAPRRRR
jgi:hypothetical protein